jgi:hypothetical protein
LAAVALEMIVPKQEGVSPHKMNTFVASCLVYIIFWMMAFSNLHLSFYGDYGTMIMRLMVLFYKRFFGTFRLMALLYRPSALISAVLGWRSYTSKPELDND